jgi:signal transduction histidine kinase
VDTILTCGRSLLSPLNEILNLSEVEACGPRTEQLLMAPRELCAEVINLLAPRAQDRGRDRSLVRRPGTPAVIPSDPTRLTQIRGNLLGNAIKFCAEGEVVVDVAATADGDLHIAVRVTGVAPERLPEIFVRFTQTDS